jgi:hypothetical protein
MSNTFEDMRTDFENFDLAAIMRVGLAPPQTSVCCMRVDRDLSRWPQAADFTPTSVADLIAHAINNDFAWRQALTFENLAYQPLERSHP